MSARPDTMKKSLVTRFVDSDTSLARPAVFMYILEQVRDYLLDR